MRLRDELNQRENSMERACLQIGVPEKTAGNWRWHAGCRRRPADVFRENKEKQFDN
jgi:hypothetical protein